MKNTYFSNKILAEADNQKMVDSFSAPGKGYLFGALKNLLTLRYCEIYHTLLL